MKKNIKSQATQGEYERYIGYIMLKDEIFLDQKNKKHILTKETQEQWLKEFNLKSIDDEFVPNFKPEVKEALERYGINEIKLGKGSLIKLIRENRLKYLDRVKPTLQEPDRIIKQDDITFIFARDFGEEKYFTSVAKDDKGEWVIVSNAPKSENGLNNKILKGGEEVYNKQAGSQINASTPYDDIAKSNIKLDSTNSSTKLTQKQDEVKENNYKIQDITNGIKERRNLQNKMNLGAKILYQSPNASSISQTLLQTSLYSANKIDMLDYNEKKMKSQATQGEQAMDMLRQEYKEKDIDKEKEFNRDKINRFGGKKK